MTLPFDPKFLTEAHGTIKTYWGLVKSVRETIYNINNVDESYLVFDTNVGLLYAKNNGKATKMRHGVAIDPNYPWTKFFVYRERLVNRYYINVVVQAENRAVDCVPISLSKHCYYLIRRKGRNNGPDTNRIATVGGFLDATYEKTNPPEWDKAVLRELQEETGVIAPEIEKLVQLSGKIKCADPLEHTFTVPFVAFLKPHAELKAGDDAADIVEVPLDQPPPEKFYFQHHNRILEMAIREASKYRQKAYFFLSVRIFGNPSEITQATGIQPTSTWRVGESSSLDSEGWELSTGRETGDINKQIRSLIQRIDAKTICDYNWRLCLCCNHYCCDDISTIKIDEDIVNHLHSLHCEIQIQIHPPSPLPPLNQVERPPLGFTSPPPEEKPATNQSYTPPTICNHNATHNGGRYYIHRFYNGIVSEYLHQDGVWRNSLDGPRTSGYYNTQKEAQEVMDRWPGGEPF